jgi:hypothetical protein
MAQEGTYALVTLEEVKDALDISKIIQDDIIVRLIDDVSSAIETFCDRQFKSRDYTNEDYDGDGSNVIYTKEYPINSISSLYDDPDRNFTSSYLIDPSNYVFYSEEGKIQLITTTGSSGMLLGNFSRGAKNIRINYNAGYDAIPYDLRMIATEITVKKLQTYSTRNIGVNSVTTQGETMNIALNDILPEHRELLKMKYKKINFGIL